MELTTHEQELVAAGGVLGGVFAFTMIVGLIIAVLFIVAWWKIFEKAGLKGWKSLIPIYNQYCLFRVSGMSGWWCFFPIIPFIFFSLAGINMTSTEVVVTDAQAANPLTWIGLIFSVISLIIAIVQVVKLAEGFRKGTVFKVVSVFFPNITSLILAFGSAKYDKKFLHD